MRSRLSVMMVLVYAVQGAFWPLLAVHLRDLGFDGRERGWIFATLAVGSMAMPLGAGQLVDRLMSGQKLLASIFAVATVFLVVFASGWVTGFVPFLVLSQLLWLVAAPAVSLANTIAFRHLEHPHEQFSRVRLWGTAGWMGIGWVVSLVLFEFEGTGAGHGAYEAFWISAGLAIVLSVYSLTLPDTPPLAGQGASMGFLQILDDARGLIARPGMGVLCVSALGLHLTTPYVFQVMPTYLESRGLPRAWISTALTLGQWPEIATLALLPAVLNRIGAKATLALGLGAWTLRYASLALDPPLWVAIAGIPLHGVGIACFTIAGQMYTDTQASRELRASGQALFLVLTAGVGSLFGSLLAGHVVARFAGDYARAFLVPCVIDAALLIYFCAAFRTNEGTENRLSLAVPPMRNDAVRGKGTRVGNLATEPADG